MNANPYAAPLADATDGSFAPQGASARQVQRAFTWWMSTFLGSTALVIGAFVLLVAADLKGLADPYSGSGLRGTLLRAAEMVGLSGAAVMLLSLVIGCVLLHRCWSAVPRGLARTTPGRAVGFLFIPLFQLYWIFVAYHGLALDLATTIRKRRLRVTAPAAGLALAMGIAWVLTITPFIGWLAMLAWPVLFFLVNLQISNAAIAILNHRAAAPAVAA